jgi:2-phospho-L-lactate guanylyltransferase
MRAILIPVKAFSAAKSRLAPHFTPEQRAALAAALCRDFFTVVGQLHCADKVFVASKEREVLDWAKARGWETIPESEQISESASVDTASRLLAERGVTALLRLPADIPLAGPHDIAPLFEQLAPPPFALLVPSGDGTGTNALLRSPPGLFPSHFGMGSFDKHIAEAARAGAETRIVYNPRIAKDVDDIEDLRAIRGQLRPGCATARWLEEHRELLG